MSTVELRFWCSFVVPTRLTTPERWNPSIAMTGHRIDIISSSLIIRFGPNPGCWMYLRSLGVKQLSKRRIWVKRRFLFGKSFPYHPCTIYYYDLFTYIWLIFVVNVAAWWMVRVLRNHWIIMDHHFLCDMLGCADISDLRWKGVPLTDKST